MPDIPLAAFDPIIGVVIAALIGPLGAYLLAARRMSGKIETSEATQLWAESKAIRDWSREQLEAANREIQELRERLDRVWQRVRELETENNNLRQQLTTAQNEIVELRESQHGS